MCPYNKHGEFEIINSMPNDCLLSITNRIGEIPIISPNPAHDFLTITGINPQLITLYDGKGKKIFSTSDYTDKIDISLLPNGFYFLHIVAVNGVIHVEKIIKLY